MPIELNARIPDGPLEQKWEKARFDMKLVNPANKRKFHVIVVGSGLAGGAAAASLSELGYQVTRPPYHDPLRRPHPPAAPPRRPARPPPRSPAPATRPRRAAPTRWRRRAGSTRPRTTTTTATRS